MDKQGNNAVLDFLERLRTSDEDLRHKEIPKYMWDPSIRRPNIWADYYVSHNTGRWDSLSTWERWNATTASNTTPVMHTATTTTNVDFIRRYW